MIFVQQVKNVPWLLQFLLVDRDNYYFIGSFHPFLQVILHKNRPPSNVAVYGKLNVPPFLARSKTFCPLGSLSISSKVKLLTALPWEEFCLYRI